MSTVERLPGVEGRSRSTPKTSFSQSTIGTGELILVGPITPLHQVPTVLKSRIDRSQIEHMRENTSGIGGGIKVIQGIPVIMTASEGFAKIHVVKGVGSKVVTPVALPGPSCSHGLTSKLNIRMVFGIENHRHAPKEVVVRRVIVQVDVLLLAIV